MPMQAMPYDHSSAPRSAPVQPSREPARSESRQGCDGPDHHRAGQADAILERKLHGIVLHLAATRENPNAADPVQQEGHGEPEDAGLTVGSVVSSVLDVEAKDQGREVARRN